MTSLLSFPDQSTIECYQCKGSPNVFVCWVCISRPSPPPRTAGQSHTNYSSDTTHNLYSSPIFMARKYSAIWKSFNRSMPPTNTQKHLKSKFQNDYSTFFVDIRGFIDAQSNCKDPGTIFIKEHPHGGLVGRGKQVTFLSPCFFL